MYKTRLMLMMSLISLIYSTNECTFNVDPTPPAPPANVAVSSGDSVIELRWDFNNEDDFEGYNLYKSTQNISEITDLTPLNGEELYFEAAFNDEEVENGKTYYYRITSVDINGNESEPSAEIKVTPFSGPPGRPKQ